MRPVGWKAWYAEGRVRTHRQAAVGGLPAGIVCVVVYMDIRPYREIVSGGDWYYLHEDGRVSSSGTSGWGVWRPPRPPPGAVAVRSTKRLPEDVYEAIMAAAREDRAWP